MSHEVSPQTNMEYGLTVRRPIAAFVRTNPGTLELNPDHIRAYLGSQIILRDNPYFHIGETAIPTGLEPYLIGQTKDPMKVAEEIGTFGDRAIKAIESMGDPYVVSRMRRILQYGRISTDVEEKQKDLRILVEADMAIGNAVRKLQAGMTKEGEDFRTQTHSLIGDPVNRFSVSLESRSESLVLPHTGVLQREVDIQKMPLDQVLARLPPCTLR